MEHRIDFSRTQAEEMLTRELLTLSNPQAESTFECGRCGKNYRYKKSMLRHLRLECGKEPQFYCPYCPHRTKHKSSLLMHISNKHSKSTVGVLR